MSWTFSPRKKLVKLKSSLWSFLLSPQPYWWNYYFPLADAVGFKFLWNKVTATTGLFTLTSFNKQSDSPRRYLRFVNCVQSLVEKQRIFVRFYMFTNTFWVILDDFYLLKFCLLLWCLSSFFKEYHKIRRGVVVCFQNLADEK